MPTQKIIKVQTSQNIVNGKIMNPAVLSQKNFGSDANFHLIYNLLAYLYLGGFVIIGLVNGFSPLLYGLFLIISLIFILPYPLLGLQLIIFLTMIFERWFTLSPLIIEYSAYKLYPLDIIIIVTSLSWLIHQIKNRQNKIIFGWPEKILALFMAVNVIYFIKSFWDINADLAIVFSSFKNYAFYPWLYFLVVYSIQSKKQFKNILHLILLTAVVLIIFIIIGLFQGEGLWSGYTPLSTAGVRFLAGTHAFYMMIASLIAVSLLAFDRFKNKSFSGLIVIVWLAGLAVSLMRHLWLSFFFGLAVLLVLIPLAHKKNLIQSSVKSGIMITALAALILLSINLFPSENFSQPLNNSTQMIEERLVSLLGSAQDTSINWRINFWRVAQKAWLKSPLLGLGFGHKLPLELAGWQTFEEIRNIHNSPLAITIQMGLIGLSLFGLFILTGLASGLKESLKNEELKPYYFGLFSALVAMLIASLFQPFLETNLTGIFLWIFLGLLRSAVIINKNSA